MTTVHAMTAERSTFHMVEDACGIAEMDIENHDREQEMASALYREPGSIGVYSASHPAMSVAVCRTWRQANIDNLLFFLTGNTARRHRAAVDMLAAGADDVQPVTIHALEMAARLHALEGRMREPESPFLRFCGCSFNQTTGDVYSPAGFVNLTRKESDLLTLLIMREGSCVTKEMFLGYAYQGRDEPNLKIVDVFASRVRQKLAALTGGRDVIETIWGRGFRFVRAGIVPALADSGRAG